MNWSMGFRRPLFTWTATAPLASEKQVACPDAPAAPTATPPLASLLAPERVLFAAPLRSKKRALERLAELLLCGAPALGPEIDFDVVYTQLLERERLGSTGLGSGVAIPHARLPRLTAPRAAFLSLQEPLEFDALDDMPVTLLLGLLIPEQADDLHLRLLAQLASIMSDAATLDQLRTVGEAETLMKLLATAQHCNDDTRTAPTPTRTDVA